MAESLVLETPTLRDVSQHLEQTYHRPVIGTRTVEPVVYKYNNESDYLEQSERNEEETATISLRENCEGSACVLSYVIYVSSYLVSLSLGI